eukprot:CAMPEP_0119493288 /NCGR_PEP_ID=MMETSP1344-20130328/17580_1 /TAXON_ID=236787 /ORGANISM="Florenciella parvula, Strain CCMP2471" /LENGTH=64 /DNA_ID=CAMNT_0007528697 /DNA_START=61 /DNA_END=252 /DNA_ORIENTATION=-
MTDEPSRPSRLSPSSPSGFDDERDDERDDGHDGHHAMSEWSFGSGSVAHLSHKEAQRPNEHTVS